MIVFLDESGDAGFKFGQGSSLFFVIALVVFDSADDAQETERLIRQLRIRLRLRPTFEFKFNKMNEQSRLEFLEAMRAAPFHVRALILDKRGVVNAAMERDEQQFYAHFVKQALQDNLPAIQGAKLRVDGFGNRHFKQIFGSYLRRELGPVLADCKFLDSKSDDLIQLADMVVGAVRRAYDSDKLDPVYHARIKHKIRHARRI